MATTITPATATITITEVFTQNGSVITKTTGVGMTVASVTYSDTRVMAIPSSGEISVLGFVTGGATIGAGTFLESTVRYIRISNRDGANFIRYRYINTGAEVVDRKLLAGKTDIITDLNFDTLIAGGAFGAFVYPDFLMAQADTAPVDIEYTIIVG